MKLRDLISSEQVLANHLLEPAFKAEWDRTAVARAVALKVLAYRTEHGLSQRVLAQELSMTQPQVARIEAGEHNPTIDTLARIADALDIEFAIDVRPHRREARLVNKRARTRNAIASYTTGETAVLLAAG